MPPELATKFFAVMIRVQRVGIVMNKLKIPYIIIVSLVLIVAYLLSINFSRIWPLWKTTPEAYLKRVYPLALSSQLSPDYYEHLDFYWYPYPLSKNRLMANVNAFGPAKYGSWVCLSWMYGNCSLEKGSAIVKNLYPPNNPNQYPYRNGTPSHHFAEIYHNGWYFEPGIFYYVVHGSGVYLNVGKTLIAKNKLDALHQLGMSYSDILQISGNFIANGNYVTTFRFVQEYMEKNKLTFQEALNKIMSSAISGDNYEFGRIADSADYDYSLYKLGKKAGYDTLQFTIQPNDNGGWGYELLDLRPELSESLLQKYTLNQKRLTQRNPFDLSKGRPCQYRIPFEVLKCEPS